MAPSTNSPDRHGGETSSLGSGGPYATGQFSGEKVDQRLDWVDVVKILGIFAIYVGHFGQSAGNLYAFVFTFHVPLFFFVAGFFANTSSFVPWRTFVAKKSREILLPFAFFNVLYLATVVVQGNLDTDDARELLLPLALGIRNQSPTLTLWFLPCLFLVSVLFDAMRRMKFSTLALLAASTVLWGTSEWFLPHRPVIEPSWVANADSALYYFLFYVLGAVLFPPVRRFTAAPLGGRARLVTALTLAAALCVAVNLYFGQDPLPMVDGVVGVPVKQVAYALVMIYLTLAAGFALARFTFLASMGRQTLYYCGNEVIIKTLVPVALGILGLSVRLDHPLSVLVYVAVLLVVAYFTVIRVESALLAPLMRRRRSRTPRGTTEPSPDARARLAAADPERAGGGAGGGAHRGHESAPGVVLAPKDAGH